MLIVGNVPGFIHRNVLIVGNVPGFIHRNSEFRAWISVIDFDVPPVLESPKTSLLPPHISGVGTISSATAELFLIYIRSRIILNHDILDHVSY